jgi:hypothetical protein
MLSIRLFIAAIAAFLGLLASGIVAAMVGVLSVGIDSYSRAFHSEPMGFRAVLTIGLYLACALIAGFFAWKVSASWARRLLGEHAICLCAASSSGKYASAWNDYRRRLNRLLNTWLGGFLLIGALVCMSNVTAQTERLSGVVICVLSPFWMIAFLAAGMRLRCFRCPRCQNFFFRNHWRNIKLVKRCAHCGLPMWCADDSGQDASEIPGA